MRALALALLSLLTLVSLTPPAVFLTAGAVAGALGCQLDEGSVHPCWFRGRDIGDTLYDGTVLGGWLSLPAAPVLLSVMVLWVWIVVRRPRRA